MNIKEKLLANKKEVPCQYPELGMCWEWQKALNGDGYGVLGWGKKQERVHRLAYEELVGEIPEGKFILHKCDNRACFNPDHIYAGTHRDNINDMMDRKRFLTGDRHWSKLKPECHRRGKDHPGSKMTDDDVVQARRDFSTMNYSISSLAKKYGVTLAALKNALIGKCWSHIKEPLGPEAVRFFEGKGSGVCQHKAKVDDLKVRQMRWMYNSCGFTQKELGVRFGLDQTTVGEIVRRKNWKHVTG